MQRIIESELFDVVVIGGGAAGLSAALTLARARRRVIVIDSGEPRNAPADGVHGFLTRDGMSPFDLLREGRREVESYGGTVLRRRVVGATAGAGGFGVAVEGGDVVRGRRILVASGLTDVLPEIPGLRDRFGRDAVHCPYCHGWEIRDRPLAVLGVSAMAVHQALLFRQWSNDVTLIRHEPVELSDDDRARLAALRIPVVTGPVESLRIEADVLTGVTVAGGRTVPVGAVTVAPRVEARAAFLGDLGLVAGEHPMGVGTRIETDAAGRTAVAGVWAAGNVADPMLQVVSAAAAGVMVAAQLNWELIEEQIEQQIEQQSAAALPA